MQVCRGNESLQIKVGDRELKGVDNFKYLNSVLTRDGYCTRKIKMRNSIAKEAFNRKILLLRSKPNIELAIKLVEASLYIAQRPGHEKLELKYFERFK